MLVLYIMSTSQHHGKSFESGVVYAGLKCADRPHRFSIVRSNTAKFDIPSYEDPLGEGIPTSVKTMKDGRGRIDLADALRISNFRLHSKTDELVDPPPHMVRLVVGIFHQAGARKVFHEAREYLVTRQEWNRLWGGIPHEEVERFSKLVKEGGRDAARAAARRFNARLREIYPYAFIGLNPKISDKNNAKGQFVRQRRVQCGVKLKDLEAVIEDKSRIRVYATRTPEHSTRAAYLQPVSNALWDTDLTFPFDLESSSRTFNV